MGLQGIVEGVKAAPGAVVEAVKGEVGKAHGKDWTYLSSIIVWAHENIIAPLPRDEESGKILKLKTVAALVMKVVYAGAYLIGVLTGVVGCAIGEVTRGLIGIKNVVKDTTTKVWSKIFPKTEEGEEAAKQKKGKVRAAAGNLVRRLTPSRKSEVVEEAIV